MPLVAMALLDLEDPLVHQVTTALLEKTVPMACPVPQAKKDLMALQVLQALKENKVNQVRMDIQAALVLPEHLEVLDLKALKANKDLLDTLAALDQ